MAVKIGHASIDERGKISGGTPGDQTGKEVCTRDWYNNSWDYVLRPKNGTIAEKSAKAMEQACANNKIGYCQNHRSTLYTQAKAKKWDISKITTSCETDCSDLQRVCATAAGVTIDVSKSNCTTSTMKDKFKATGKYDVLTDSKYRTSDKYLKRGDILVRAGYHTVMVLSDGSGVKATTSTVTYYKKYTGKSMSIVDALKSLGINSTLSNRTKIAKANGISNYTGTASQNTKILNLLKGGRLIKP